jgi:4-hydroxybenzoate polyprenyltransferase
MALPRSGVELGERIAARWRWFVYRVRFHPLTTNELPRLLATVNDYVQLTRLDRPIGIWLLMWPTLWALWIAGRGRPAGRLFIIFTAGTVLMRSAGCAINDYADRSFDPHVKRTRNRPLAAGRISAVEALVLFAALSLTALLLAVQLNSGTLLLAVIGAGLAVTYPFIKRFLSVPQLYLGVTFGWGIPMAFKAELDQVTRVGWLLLLTNVLWVTVYDTIYAMVDRDDDVKIGVRFGDSDRHIIAALQAMTLLALYLIGGMIHMGPWYYAGLVAGGIFFLHHLWLIRRREREACLRAFLNNHYFGLSVFLGIACNYQFGR